MWDHMRSFHKKSTKTTKILLNKNYENYISLLLLIATVFNANYTRSSADKNTIITLTLTLLKRMNELLKRI
jgi:hypothetical protein